ncbi:MAG: DUF6455 family protein [Woeseiaceae bacterium]|nr:DUF6455 family protein [Woeseiaceae bacterium]MDX2608530.1 DUF6455 family protein [Woeseiaceae bacterium]
MDITLTQTIVAIVMVGLSLALIIGYRAYLASNSERRMLSMLDSLGLDPEIASSGELNTIMGEARKRCEACTTEDVCERWLRGDEEGDNAFCPNKRVFDILSKYKDGVA